MLSLYAFSRQSLAPRVPANVFCAARPGCVLIPKSCAMRRTGKRDVQVWMLRAVGLLFALLFAVSLLDGEAPSLLVGPAAAMSCYGPAQFEVHPPNGETAPRNARVVVVASPSIGMGGWEGHDPPRIALFEDAGGGAEIPSSAEKAPASAFTTIVLTPRTLLEADRAYAVVAGDDRIGRFRTSAEIDREPPDWQGVREIVTWWCRGARCNRPGAASLLVEPATDAGHPASQLSYALFADQSKTPFLYLRPQDGRLLLHAEGCAPNFDQGPDQSHLTIRAVDLAGNFSDPHRYRIDTDGVSHPRSPTFWILIATAVVCVLLAAYGLRRYQRARLERYEL